MIKHSVKNLFTKPVFRNMSILVSGTVLAQLVIVGFQVVLRRLFSPTDFGAFAVYMSLLGIIATLSSFRYEQAIVLPQQNEKAYHLLWLSVIIAFLTSSVLGLFVIFLNPLAVQLTNIASQYSNWLYFLPLSVFLFAVYQALNYYLIRLKMFRQSASNKIERRVFEGSIQTLSGYLKWPLGLVWGDIVGQLANVVFASIKLKNVFRAAKIRFQQIKSVAMDYKHFPIHNALPSLLNAFSLLLPVVFINRFFDAHTTGLFDLARLVLIIPLSLITASLSQVMLQQFSEYRNQNASVKKPLLKIAAILAIAGAAFIGGVSLLAPWLLGLVFGIEWIDAGHYAQILVWAFGLKFLVSPFNILFTVFERLKWLAWWQYIYFVLILLLMLVPHQNIGNYLLFYTLFEVISSLVAAAFCIHLVKNYENERLKRVEK